MPIHKEQYQHLKAYFDFQRKKEYNKEVLRKAVEQIALSPEALFNEIWNKMTDDDMHDVPTDWVPKNDDLKIEGEQ